MAYLSRVFVPAALCAMAVPALGGGSLDAIVESLENIGQQVGVSASTEDQEGRNEFFEDLRFIFPWGHVEAGLAQLKTRGNGFELLSQFGTVRVDAQLASFDSFATYLPGTSALQLLQGEWDPHCEALDPHAYATFEHFSMPFPSGYDIKGDILNIAARQETTEQGCSLEVTYFFRDLEVINPDQVRHLHIDDHTLILNRDPSGSTNWSIHAEGVENQQKSKSEIKIEGQFDWPVSSGQISLPYQTLPEIFLDVFKL